MYRTPVALHRAERERRRKHDRHRAPASHRRDSLKRIREFPKEAKHDAGYQLDQVQRGKQPADFKPMPTIGPGVEEIRIWDDTGTYRVVYTARLHEAIYVLHAFQKKSQVTSSRDLVLAKERFAQLMKERR